MKLNGKALGIIMALSIFVLSSCHKSGCPGQITDVDTEQFQEVDENC